MAGSILVFGATGNVGRPLVEALVARGQAVKAASRTGQPVAGAEGVAVDMADLASVEAALAGVDRMYLLMPGGDMRTTELLLPIVKAAAARHVKVVLQTALGVDADDSIPYRQVEIALQNSGTPFVILRPNWFADNFQTYWKAGIAHGQIALPAGEGRTSFVTVRDIAASAAAALTTDRFDGQAFNLTGPQAHGYAEAAALISAAIGKPVAYAAVDDATFVGILTGAGVPANYAQFLASIFHPVREGWAAGVTDAVETLTGRRPTSLETYVRDNAGALAA